MMTSTEEFAARIREAMPWAEVRVIQDEVLITCPPERQEEAIAISKQLHADRFPPLTCGCDVCQCYGPESCKDDLSGWDASEI